jgi:ribonucleoside-diphosphate reductase alpha chain
MESILELAKTEGMLFKYGSGTGSNLSPLRGPRRRTSRRRHGLRARSRSCAASTPLPASSSRAARPAAPRRWSSSTSTTQTSSSSSTVQGARGEEGLGPHRRRLRRLASMSRRGLRLGLLPERNHSVRVTDAFMRAVERGHFVHDPRASPTGRRIVPAATLWREMAEAAWICGDPGIQFDTTINNWHTCPNTAPHQRSNPCSEYMFLDDSACNLASLNLMKFREADGTFDVERSARVRRLILAQEIIVDIPATRPSASRAQQPRVPPARPRLRQPRRAADGSRSAVRQRRRPRLRRRDHRAASAARPTRRARRDRQARWARSTATRRTASPCSASSRAPRRPSRHGHRRQSRARSAAARARAKVWDDALTARPARLPQRAGHGAGAHRHHRLHDGLRHHRRRTRHRAGQVQEARRRRHDEDRQPDGPEALQMLGYTRRPRPTRSSPTSTRTRPSRARPGLKPEHLPVFDCAFKPANGERTITADGPREDDGAPCSRSSRAPSARP